MTYLLTCSDDRTVDKFRNMLEATTQMRATLDADSRPNCAVIDEIDGAPTVCKWPSCRTNVQGRLLCRKERNYFHAPV